MKLGDKLMNKLKFLITLIVTLLIIGCGDSNPEQKAGGPGKRGFGPDSPGGKAQAGVPVEVTYLEKGDITNQLLFSSSLETENMTEIFPKINGEITKIIYDEGDNVKKGTVLLKIDDREYRLSEQRAMVNYQQLKSELARLKKLINQELVSQEEFEKNRYSVEQARLDWELAKLNLTYTNIKAPFPGVIAERSVNLGDRVQASTKLYILTNLTDKIVKIYIPQNEIANVKLKQPAVIQADVISDQQFEGWVKRISPMIDPQSGTFKVTIGVNDPENKILPGIFVNVALIVDSHKQTKLLPKSALVYESDRAYFFVVKGDSTVKVEIKRGFDDAKKVEVLNKIPAGTAVVVVGQNGLKDGSEIRIVSYKKYRWQKMQESFSDEPSLKPKNDKMEKSPKERKGKKRRPPHDKKRGNTNQQKAE